MMSELDLAGSYSDNRKRRMIDCMLDVAVTTIQGHDFPHVAIALIILVPINGVTRVPLIASLARVHSLL